MSKDTIPFNKTGAITYLSHDTNDKEHIVIPEFVPSGDDMEFRDKTFMAIMSSGTDVDTPEAWEQAQHAMCFRRFMIEREFNYHAGKRAAQIESVKRRKESMDESQRRESAQ